jgi:hypothetical protein
MVRSLVIAVVAAASLLLLGLGLHNYYYPCGFRSGKMTTFIGVLAAYAQENEGWYPRGGATPLASLQKLYSKYCVEGRALAGMSGDEATTLRYLKTGKMIDEAVSSWVYHPGFRNDDNPEIAIIWERRAGIFVNGSRSDGHAVGYADGGCAQISSSKWPEFLKRQEELRNEALSGARQGKLQQSTNPF